MNSKIDLIEGRRARIPFLLAALLLLPTGGAVFCALPWVAESWAQSKKSEEGRYANVRTRRTPAMSDKIYRAIAESQRLLDEEKDYSGAFDLLDDLLGEARSGRRNLSPYESANIWNTMGYIRYSQNRYRDAINAYRNVLRDPEQITTSMLQNTLYVLAQLYMVQEDYKQAVTHLLDWLDIVEEPPPQAVFLLAQAYFQQNDLRNSMNAAERAMSLAEERGIAIRESWYLLLRALYYENRDYQKALAVLGKLAGLWPKRDYWVQLGAIHGQLENEEFHSIAMESAYIWDMLKTESDWVNLTYLLLSQEMPYKAAKILELGLQREIVERNLKHLELLGSAWRGAQEMDRALPILEEAAALSEKGEIYSQLASIYLDLYRYEEAVRSAEKALEKGDLKRLDNLQIVFGMSLFNLDRFDEASRAFKKASEDERSTKLAEQWRVYIRKEVQRRKMLARDPLLYSKKGLF